MSIVKTIRDVMRCNVEKISPAENLRVAANIMGEKHIGSLVVIGTAGPIGLLAETDIIWKVIAHGRALDSTLVLEVMSISYGRISPDASLKDGARAMLEKKRILVFDEDKMVGIVSASDMVRGIAQSKSRVGIEGFMSRRVVCLDDSATALEAAQVMASRRIGSVLVSKKEEPYGIFAERDLMTKIAAKCVPFTTELKFLASTPLITSTPNIALSEAAEIMVANNIKRLPLFRGKDLVGIITARDLVEVYAKSP